MFFNPILKKLSFLTILVILTSCSTDTEFIEIPITMEDQQLESSLINLAGNLDYYILPESNNYSSIPSDPKNPLNGDKVLLGKLLFHETGLGVNSKKESHKATYSCASCHHSAAGFQSGILQGIGDGGMGFGLHGESRVMAPDYTSDLVDVQPIRSPTVLNSAYQKLMLWNGQFGATDANIGTEANWTDGTPKATNNLGFEGVETQAIAGLTVHRMGIDKEFCDEYKYATLFDSAFPELDITERYSLITAGLAIAAYERTLLATNTNFQNWLKGDQTAMTKNEKKGALLFFGKAKCYQCHNGPALNSDAFYALGIKDLSGPNIHGVIDETTKKGRGGFTNSTADNYKYKVPQLYNLADVNFFGHGGGFSSVRDVITYKNNAQKENAIVPTDALAIEFQPLGLNEEEIDLLTEFIEKSLFDNNLKRYNPIALPTGLCFPNADMVSRVDMGCN
tara:strand:- start:18 stop:1370 length:1353 start_codon:yes stop_codon:yes gene_type:complete